MYRKSLILKKVIHYILLLCFLGSCSMMQEYKDKFKDKFLSKKEKLRIVDLNGEYRPVKMYTLPANDEIIASQRKLHNNKRQSYQKAANNDQNNIDQQVRKILLNNKIKDPVKTEKEPIIQYDMSSSIPVTTRTDNNAKNLKTKQSSVKLTKSKKINKRAHSSRSSKSLFIQIGSFASNTSARITLSKAKNLSQGIVKKVKVKNKYIYRVLLGPINNKSQANQLLNQVKNSGFKDAFISKNGS